MAEEVARRHVEVMLDLRRQALLKRAGRIVNNLLRHWQRHVHHSSAAIRLTSEVHGPRHNRATVIGGELARVACAADQCLVYEWCGFGRADQVFEDANDSRRRREV